MDVKSKILFFLTFSKDTVKFSELKKYINTSKRWLETVLETLMKNELVGYNTETDGYFLLI